jgi:peptidoglycan hydrolase-like protein with peptidoglycan-binding domain
VSNTSGPLAGSERPVRTGRTRRLGRAVAVLGLTVGLTAAMTAVPALSSAQAAASKPAITPVPPTPAGLPSKIEGFAPYVGQDSCDPNAKVGTLALARLLALTYPGTGYLVERPCGSESIASEHADGRAIDWLVSTRIMTQKAWGDAFVKWLLDTDAKGNYAVMARRFGVMYIIWNNMYWTASDPLKGWQDYSTCATHTSTDADSVCSRDRMHISLSWAGALKQTSYWTKRVAANDYGPCAPADLNWAPPYSTANPTSCPRHPVVMAPRTATSNASLLVKYSGATVSLGDTGPIVVAVQKALGVPADGNYGQYTADAVAAYQDKFKLAETGSMDAATWRQMLITSGAKVVEQTPAPVTSPLTKYKNLVLRLGSRGPAVTAVQQRLKLAADGIFGKNTQAAVKAFQKSKNLSTTGEVDPPTWKALGA